MNPTDELTLKYEAYLKNGNSVFAVTLSTYVQSEWFARKHMHSYWRNHFIYRVLKQLSYKLKAKLDHDYVIERSPEGHYHFHGLLALPASSSGQIWNCGSLRKPLDLALKSLGHCGRHRMFKVNDFLIEPITNVAAWAIYSTKSPDSISWE
ncbi:MAG: hypothetical protein ABI843_11715 [Dokdonella sp.]